MNETIIQIGLALAIGLLCGILSILSYDMKKYEQRIQSERTKAQAMIQVLQGRLQRAEKGHLVARKDATWLRDQLEARGKTAVALQEQVQQLQVLVQASQTQLQELEQKQAYTQQQLENTEERLEASEKEQQTAVAQNSLLQENVAHYQAQLDEIRNKNQALCQRIAVADVELRHLQQDLTEAQTWQYQAQTIKQENSTLVGQLNKMELQLHQLQADLEAAHQQANEAAFVYKKLNEAEAKLVLTEKRAQQLQEKFSSMQHAFDYTGKNQLQLIRGIGPAYARRLNESGINDLEDLADCTPEKLVQILGPKKWQQIPVDAWIQEAKALVARI